MLRGLASPEDTARYDVLAAELPSGASTEVERALRRLDETLKCSSPWNSATRVAYPTYRAVAYALPDDVEP